MAYVVVCSDCRGKFKWDLKGGNPKFCIKCGASFGNDPDDDDICMPAFLSPKSAATDKVYRDMEKGSELRAELAAEKLGVPVSDMSAIKITDFSNNAPALNNDVTQYMAAAQQYTQAHQVPPVVGNVGGSQGVNYSPAVQSGPYPNAGARMRSIIHQNHTQELTKLGMPLNNVTSDRPAIETLQPGYRRRG